MRHISGIVLLLILGAIIGGGGVESFHRVRDRQRHEIFEQRLRCKQLADAYAKSNSDDSTTVFIERIDFSSRRNSCLAAVSTAHRNLWNYDVVDVITGETVHSGMCFEDQKYGLQWCGNGRDMKLTDERDKAFDAALR